MCRSCGTAQKLLDARQYLEELKLSVSEWLRKAVPVGMDLSHSANVDPVARYGVFVNNVKPRLDTEFTEYRFNMASLLSQNLTTFPYILNDQIHPSNDPKEVFSFQAKVQSVYPLAVNPEAKKAVDDANAVAVSYAYLLNNAKLLHEPKGDRFALMADNFSSAAKAMEAANEMYPGLVERLQANALSATASDAFVNGKLPESHRNSSRALALYETAGGLAASSMTSTVMSQAIRDERLIADSIMSLTQASTGDSMVDAKLVTQVQAIVGVLQSFPQVYSNPTRVQGIISRLQTTIAARKAMATMRVLPGSGNLLYPFWVIDLKYSFSTGALWTKKGKEVSELLLVAADAFAGGAWNSPGAVSDVFRARAKGGVLDGLTGKETSISGGGLSTLLAQATNSHLSMPAIPALSSENDAAEMATSYLNTTINSDAKVRDKLRLSAPRVVELAYVPTQYDGQRFSFPQLGAMAPRETGNATVLAGLSV